MLNGSGTFKILLIKHYYYYFRYNFFLKYATSLPFYEWDVSVLLFPKMCMLLLVVESVLYVFLLFHAVWGVGCLWHLCIVNL